MIFSSSYYKTSLIAFSLLISTFSFAQTKPKVGLVLSGGGAKGIAHIGVIRELEKKGIKPDYIVGTSMGALIGGLYACGYTPDELDTIINSLDWEYLLNDEIKRSNYLVGQSSKNKTALISLPLKGLTPNLPSGLYAGHNILTLIEILTRNYSKKMNFDELEIPFRCIGTNIETGEEKVFNNIRLADALRASMSIPSVFNPYEIDNELYVDGGLVNNFPTDIAKEMGAEIIIGVDVGAIAYKKEEITSIVRVLDQATSFYNYRVAEKNKKLCNIYIRPDISKMSILNFDDVRGIINEGVIATNNVNSKIDSVFKKYNLSPIPTTTKTYSPILTIDSASISTNIQQKKHHKEAQRLIKGKVNLKKNNHLSVANIQNEMNRIYASRYFKSVSLTFEPKDSSHYNMIINAQEKSHNSLNIGLRYDTQFGVNTLVNTQFRNLLIYGSLLESSFIIGQSPHLKVRYTTDRGSSLGFGSSFNYTKFRVYTYQNSIKNTTFNYRRANWDLFLHANMGNANRIILGAEASVFGLESTQSVSDLIDIKERNYSAYLSYHIDTWDRSFFPNKGINLKMRSDVIRQEDASILHVGWMRINAVIPLSKKIKLITETFVGFGSIGVDTTLYRYEVGGMAQNRIEWYSSMPGLEFLEHGASNNWVISLSPRYEFYENHFITYTFAVSSLNNNVRKLYTVDNKKYMGMSLKYGFLSMFGPIELSVDYSLNNKNSNTFINLGYWF